MEIYEGALVKKVEHFYYFLRILLGKTALSLQSCFTETLTCAEPHYCLS